MGIKGLTQYLHSKITQTEEIIPEGSTIHIDGNGFLFNLLQNNINEIHKDLMGCYDCVDRIVKAEINRLLSMNLILKIYFDGISQMKEESAMKRMNEQNKYWDNLEIYCKGSMELNNQQSNFPLPRLIFNQLKSTLSSFERVVIVYCEYEADRDIALACSIGNKDIDIDRELHYCYGFDSDFFVFKDCPYIEFGKLKEGLVVTNIWRRSITAKQLGLTESQLIELCLIVGNDYTDIYKSYYQFGMKPIPRELLNRYSRYTPDIIYNLLLRNSVDSMTTSTNVNVTRALQFSRDVYNLNEISKYPVDKDISHLRTFSFSKQHEEIVNRNLNEDHKSIIESLNVLISNAADTRTYHFIDNVIIEAFSVMLNQLTSVSEWSSHTAKLTKYKLSYNEAKAAYYYQHICSLYIKKYPSQFAPYQLYDGKVYNESLESIKSSSNNKISEPRKYVVSNIIPTSLRINRKSSATSVGSLKSITTEVKITDESSSSTNRSPASEIKK